MIISPEVWNASTGIELVRSGNDVTFYLSGSASGYYNPDLGYWEWYGYMELTFGPDTSYIDQYYDRPMDLSLTQTLVPGVALTGSYYVDGSYSVNGSGSFSVMLFDTATTYGGTRASTTSSARRRLTTCRVVQAMTGWMAGPAMTGSMAVRGATISKAAMAATRPPMPAQRLPWWRGFTTACWAKAMRRETAMSRSKTSKAPASTITSTATTRATRCGVAMAWTRLFGLKGNDVLEGGKGADMLFGDAGSDTASYASSAARVVANLTTGTGTAGDAAGDVYNGIENLTGSAFDDQLTGDAVANILRGGSGNDVLRGLAGDDTLSGGNGDDLLLGGAGADMIDGGLGVDTVSYAGATAGVVANLAAPSGNTRDAAGDVYVSIENLTGTDHNDRLTGNTFENYIIGGGGNDVLNGGDASDRLRGGDGNDAFVFDSALNALANVDSILDYSVADDRIWLDDAVFTALTAGQGLGAAFVIGSAATTAAHRIIYNAVNGGLYYDADGVGGADAILFARIGAGQAMTAAEFLVV